MTQTFNHTPTIETSGVSGTGSSDPSFKWVTEPVPVTPCPRDPPTEVILIDGYVGADTFHILETRSPGVQATIYTDSVGPRIQSFQANHESEYGTTRHIEVRKYRTDFHDRFLIIDDDVYHFGASLKDLGKRLFAFDKMGLSKALILSQV